MFYRTAFGGVDSGNPAIGLGSAIGVIIYVFTFLISILSIQATRSREVEL
jgi:raffinose/stachyose/melibiose transport system permease protein